jgi:hypothetical protein
MRFRGFCVYVTTVFSALVFTSPAFADNGEGLLGESGFSDETVTFISLGIVACIPILIFVLSVIQRALERRKEEKKAQSLRQRMGW